MNGFVGIFENILRSGGDSVVLIVRNGNWIGFG